MCHLKSSQPKAINPIKSSRNFHLLWEWTKSVHNKPWAYIKSVIWRGHSISIHLRVDIRTYETTITSRQSPLPSHITMHVYNKTVKARQKTPGVRNRKWYFSNNDSCRSSFGYMAVAASGSPICCYCHSPIPRTQTHYYYDYCYFCNTFFICGLSIRCT